MQAPSNFSFLNPEWPALFNKAQLPEHRATTEPISSASYARLALKEVLYKVYKFEGLELPYNRGLNALLDNPIVTEIMGRAHINGAHIIRKTGNAASHHGQRVSAADARVSVKYLFDIIRWFALYYSEAEPILPNGFDESLIQQVGADARKRKEQEAEADKAAKQLQGRLKALEAERDEAVAFAKTAHTTLEATRVKLLAEAREFAEQRREQRETTSAAHNLKASASFSESETRTHLIDADLREAGWDTLHPGHELEYPVQGMPVTPDNPKGNGFVDYVLWGTDGLPLAVIEAKKTANNPQVGKHQARLYANCLEAKFGRRPIIYYSNGFETYLLDEAFYSAERQVFGFHKRDELELMIQRRHTRLDPREAAIDHNIAGRSYQLAAIKAVVESLAIAESPTTFRGNRRKALLVMATGSGKTRTASALCKLLFETNWAKRILFLADRKALVRQAKNSFADHLPNYAAISLVHEKDEDKARLVFSTYQSILNRIDGSREENDTRHYGIGHFDLIIVDEAHRSVYNRYRAIFAYFDSMVLGLTATPKGSIDHNTYEFFGANTGDPTFSYELEEAVPTYLKGYRNIPAQLGFMQDGVKYSKLSADEKTAYEETFRDGETGLFPNEIGAGELNKKLFNQDTVDKVLDLLMEQGIRIEDGNSIGRTIIFAANQDHAEFIAKCFTERYPQLASDFMSVVHNGVSHAQDLIDNFCDKDKELMPRIAVSVDMMDTGIDAPRVLNLVFFKRVRSYAKFWQMIGRGTRLCPDAFGPGLPKEYFLIFDVCANFEFFEALPNGIEASVQVSGATRLFRNRLQLMTLMCKGDEEERAFAKTIQQRLHWQAEQLASRGDITAKIAARWVDKYRFSQQWDNLGEAELKELHDHIAVLIDPEDSDVNAQRFDALMVSLQLAKALAKSNESSYYQSLETIATRLLEKTGIPEVRTREPLLRSMTDPNFYKDQRQRQLDDLRVEIRGLIQYLDTTDKQPMYTNFEDSIIYELHHEAASMPRMSSEIYRKRMATYIRANQDQIVIRKLMNNKPITAAELALLEELLFDGEERGNRADFKEQLVNDGTGAMRAPLLTIFIRSIVGLLPKAVDEVFADFIRTNKLTAAQITFINQIKRNLQEHGLLEPNALFKDPYTTIHDGGLLGIFDKAQSAKIVSLLEGVNKSAGLVG